MSEYEKYQELQSKSQKMQEDYDRQLEEMEASKEQALSELTEYFETKLQEKTGQLEQVKYRLIIYYLVSQKVCTLIICLLLIICLQNW